jgi:competence protein ComEC
LLLAAFIIVLVVAALAVLRRRQRIVHWCLLGLAGILAAGWHHLWEQPFSNDIGRFAQSDVKLVRVAGTVLEAVVRPPREDELTSRPSTEQTWLIVRASAVELRAGWTDATGRCRVMVSERLAAEVGDRIEAFGELQPFRPPQNPGESDLAQFYRDQGIGASLRVETAAAVRILERGERFWPDVALARLRFAARRELDTFLPTDQAALARALLLGETTALDSGQLTGFQRTGVYHVLAISGQHLSILCLMLWPLLGITPTSRRSRAIMIALLAITYALFTGARAPILRAAIMVTAFCAAIILRRQPHPLNALALAWLVLLVLNPADVFRVGCQISFLCVLLLLEVVWPLQLGSSKWNRVDQLLFEARPAWQQVVAKAGWQVLWAYAATALLWIALTPLAAANFHLVSPAGLLIGPPLVLLTAIALAAGFAFLLLSPLSSMLATPAGVVLQASLWLCEELVRIVEKLPYSYWYTPGPPAWWLAVFYGIVLLVLLVPWLRPWWRTALAGLLVWCFVLGTLPARSLPPAELRCTFLAVGHGSCAVLELPDGRVLLYDVGALLGPEVAQRQVAPFLWSRGITTIDEVFLSHADLDHFNGLPQLMERFAIGQVSVTPSFFGKNERGLVRLGDALLERGVQVRVLSKGRRLSAGPADIEVLHPPENGPSGTENARSLVLLIRHGGQSLLLTGDLEEPGLGLVTAQPFQGVDVLLAPHHGSAASNTERFAAWARPRLAVSSEGRERGRRVNPYQKLGAELWRTADEGAVTVTFGPEGVRASAYTTGRAWRGF